MSYRFAGRSEQFRASLHRKTDADVLRANKRWLGAMYFVGYAVECALKARLMERHQCHNLRQLELRLSKMIGRDIDLMSHSLDVLMEYTGATYRVGRNPLLNRAWGIVRNWSVHWRYDPRESSEGECRRFFEAIDRVRRFVESSI